MGTSTEKHAAGEGYGTSIFVGCTEFMAPELLQDQEMIENMCEEPPEDADEVRDSLRCSDMYASGMIISRYVERYIIKGCSISSLTLDIYWPHSISTWFGAKARIVSLHLIDRFYNGERPAQRIDGGIKGKLRLWDIMCHLDGTLKGRGAHGPCQSTGAC